MTPHVYWDKDKSHTSPAKIIKSVNALPNRSDSNFLQALFTIYHFHPDHLIAFHQSFTTRLLSLNRAPNQVILHCVKNKLGVRAL